MSDENKIQIAVVGDTHVGKTSLVFSYAKDEFNEKYVTTVAEEYSISDIIYQGQKIALSVWDLSAQDDHVSLRDFAYSKADGVIFCFTLAE